jgi:hypothetical protein
MPSSLSRGNWANPASRASLNAQGRDLLDATQALEHPGSLPHAPGGWTPPLVIPRQGICGRGLAYICVCCRDRRTGCLRCGRAAASRELSVHP